MTKYSTRSRLARLTAALALVGSMLALPCAEPAWPQSPAPAVAPAPAPAAPKIPRVLIVLDPAHGGDDTGARLGGDLLEKDIALSLSFRLRSLLAARGFSVVATRDSVTGASPTLDQRAEMANHANGLACVLLHATATGNGVHIFNSSLPAVAARRNSFLPWDSAQSASIDRSLRLAAEMHSAFDRARIPATMGRTFLRPLDNLTCPAVAIEMAPLAAADGKAAAEVSNPAYQQRVAEAVAWALMEWRMRTAGGPDPNAGGAR